ncbi:alpha/beta fold hydrolase [Streptomyces sp. NPDC002845]
MTRGADPAQGHWSGPGGHLALARQSHRGPQLDAAAADPRGRPAAELVTWMTLLARSCRSSLAPAPLPEALLARSRRVTNLVATGEHDVFLPPSRLASPASRHLGVVVRTVPGAGHLVVEEHPETVVTLVAALMSANTNSGL